MTLEENLGWAQHAVAFVSGQLHRGASNREGDAVFDFLWRWLDPSIEGGVPEDLDACVGNVRDGQGRGLRRISRQRKPTVKDRIFESAYWALEHHCGNCGEQTAVAVAYLYLMGVFPLEYMHMTNGDHAFVLIGRPDSVPADDPSLWRAPMAVADPWYGSRVYPASRMLEVWGPDNEYSSALPQTASTARWTSADRPPIRSDSQAFRSTGARAGGSYARVVGGPIRSRVPTGLG